MRTTAFSWIASLTASAALYALPAAANTSSLTANQLLIAGQSLVAPSCGYHLDMQSDGNLVLYEGFGTAAPRWSSATAGSPGSGAILQSDGNFVVYMADNGYEPDPLWATGTFNLPGSHLSLQDDGNLVLYSGTAVAWASNTSSSESIGQTCQLQSKITHAEFGFEALGPVSSTTQQATFFTCANELANCAAVKYDGGFQSNGTCQCVSTVTGWLASTQYASLWINAPTVTGMSTQLGVPGSVISITGTNFSAAAPPAVSFGGVPSPKVTCPTSTSCLATVPAGQGAVTVTAQFPPSYSFTAGQFSYEAASPRCTPASTCGLEIISATSPFQSVSTVTVSCQSAPQEVQQLVGGNWVSLASFASNASLPNSTVADIYDIGLQSPAGVTTSGAAVGSVQQIRACTVAGGTTLCDSPASISIVSCPVAGNAAGPGGGGCAPRSCGTGYYWESSRCACAKDFCACGGTYPKCTVCQ